MLAEINIFYLSVNLSSAERPKVISTLSGLTLCTFIVGNINVEIFTLHFDGVFDIETISILFEFQLF